MAAAVRPCDAGHSFVCLIHRQRGDFSKALEYHVPHLAIAKEVGDRAGEVMADGNLGNLYHSQGDSSMAVEYQTQHLAIAKEVGYREGGGVNVGIGKCHTLLNEFVKAVAYYEANTQATEIGLAHTQAHAALGVGMALTQCGFFEAIF